jgi:nucleolar protein 9
MEPKTQGALLLQSLLHLSAPHHEFVLRRQVYVFIRTIIGSLAQSVHSMPVRQLLEIAYHPTSSRVLDAIFDSPIVSLKAKHKLIMYFIGEFHHLVDDRIGSRIGDRCMLVADPYLKVWRSVLLKLTFTIVYRRKLPVPCSHLNMCLPAHSMESILRGT